VLTTLIVTAILSLFTLGDGGLAPIHYMNNELVAIAKKTAQTDNFKAKIKELSKKLDKNKSIYGKAEAELREKFWSIDSDYNSTETEYQEIITEYEKLSLAIVNDFLLERELIKSALTKKQWEECYSKKSKKARKLITK